MIFRPAAPTMSAIVPNGAESTSVAPDLMLLGGDGQNKRITFRTKTQDRKKISAAVKYYSLKSNVKKKITPNIKKTKIVPV